MSHIYDLSNINLLRPSMVTIGVFDGVHRGHQHLIRGLVSEAHAEDRLAVVLTFFPHPDIVLRKLEGRYYLTTPEQRADLMLELGVDVVVTHPFDDQIRTVRAADFVDQLVRYLRLKKLWVGADFALGYQREGDVAFLSQQGEEKGFEVDVVDLVASDALQENISSTLIRELVQAGKMEDVRGLLGRGYALSGEVIKGKQRGRTIGFPTANIAVWDEQLIPMNGVYAGWAYLGDERFIAMTNVGVSPTFEYKGVTVESYLLDFDRDIYGETLTITFEKFLRPEQKYDGLDALIAQITKDVEAGRAYMTALDAKTR
jgi:riboflavin kinase / FMN adenylyltransferase